MMFWFIMCASASLALTLHTAASKNGPPKAFCVKTSSNVIIDAIKCYNAMTA